MKGRERSALVASMALALGVAACASGPMTKREEGIAAGAVIGATSGTLIGAAAGDPAAGAIIGGVMGAVTGGVIGDAHQARDPEPYYYEQRARAQEEELRRQRAEIARLQRERGQLGFDAGPYEPGYSQPPGFYDEQLYYERYYDDGDYYRPR